MPRDPTTGVFTRVDNSFSDPVDGTIIDPSDATFLFDDYDDGLNETPIISVKYFGATGDGVTNDSAAVTRAVTAANAIGAALYFPTGSYLTDQIDLEDGTSIYGDGPNSTFIVARANSQTQISSSHASVSDSKNIVRDLQLHANGKTGVIGIYNKNAFYSNYENLYFTGQLQSFFIQDTNYWTIKDVIVQDNADGTGVPTVMAQATSPLYVQFGTIISYKVNSTGSAIAASDALLHFRRFAVGSIIDFQCNKAWGGVGILFDGDCQGLTVEDSVIIGASKGIQFAANGGVSPTFMTVANSHFDQSTSIGVSIEDACTAISLQNTNVTSAVTTGVKISGTASDVRLVSNTLHDNPTAIESATSNGIISILSNTIRAFTADGIKLSSGNTFLIKDNQFVPSAATNCINTVSGATIGNIADNAFSNSTNGVNLVSGATNFTCVNNTNVSGSVTNMFVNAGGVTNTTDTPIKTPTTTTNASYAMLATDVSIIFNVSGTTTTTLLSPAGYPGRTLYVKTITSNAVNSASSNVVPNTTATAGTAILAATAGKWAILQSDGTNWITMASN